MTNDLKLYLFHDSFLLKWGIHTIRWFTRDEAIEVCQRNRAPIINCATEIIDDGHDEEFTGYGESD